MIWRTRAAYLESGLDTMRWRTYSDRQATPIPHRRRSADYGTACSAPSTQLLAKSRVALPMRSGSLLHQNYKYQRAGCWRIGTSNARPVQGCPPLLVSVRSVKTDNFTDYASLSATRRGSIHQLLSFQDAPRDVITDALQ
jgi:hypothetical protein